jgi:phosphoglycerate kinase
MEYLSIIDVPSAELSGKRIFLRVDYNVPIKGEIISEHYRITHTIQTIEYLLKKETSIVIASHHEQKDDRGNPVYLSLEPVKEALQDMLNQEVKFKKGEIDEKALKEARNLKPGEILMLDNLRFDPREKAYSEKPDEEYCKFLASFGDVYVFEAFGAAHRKHVSTNGMVKYFKRRLIGILVKKELGILEKIRDNPEKPFCVVVGGGKVNDKLEALKNLAGKADVILTGGLVAHTFLKALGKRVGREIIEDEWVKTAKEILNEHRGKIILPVDYVVRETSGKITVVDNEIPEGCEGFDIGPKTMKKYAEELRNKATIFWNGPLGKIEEVEFENGSAGIAREIALCWWRGATTVVGGGDTITALNKAGVMENEFTHISTGGGATLQYLAGKVLPALEHIETKE